MSALDLDEQVPAPAQYRPSGRFNGFAFVPLLTIGAAIALAAAFVLLLLESNLYVYFVTPIVVGTPVFAATWAIVRFSSCRNPAVGTLTGLLLAAIYYVGYWELSYRANVVAQGPFMVAIVRQIGGAPGLPGYVNFRCKTSKPVHHPGGGGGNVRPPNRVDYVFNWTFFAGEAVLIAGLAVAIGRGWAQRVYYERERRWASRVEFRLPPATLSTVAAAMEVGDWATIAALPRVASIGNNTTKSVYFRVEYLAGGTDAPAYVTLGGTSLPKDVVRSAGIAKSWLGRFINQAAIDPASAQLLARHFPDVKLAIATPGPEKTESEATAPPPLGELFDPLAEDRPRARKARVQKTDFREPAVAATRALLDEEEQAQPWAVDSACCLPTGLGPRAVRSAAWWKAKALGTLFVLAFACLGLAAWAEDAQGPFARGTPLRTLLLVVGGGGAVVLMGLLLWVCFGGDGIQKWLLIRRLGQQPGSLLAAAAGLPTRLLRVEDAGTYHVQKLSPEDVCVCIFDAPNRRVLLDGISHRYIIRAEDVASFWPLQSGDKVSIRIDYTVGDVPLNLVVATDNPLAFVLHGVFAHRALGKLVSMFVAAFGRDVSGAGPVAPRRSET